ncbi:MAG: nucleotidyltransferase family protein, partial [bacterium]|nr:nucleotidyltransferase family protein [bacterium]
MFFIRKNVKYLKTAAIIAEFNPLHNGHKYLMDQARSMGAQHIIVVLGGNFTQRGDLALFSKFIRAKTALACGADLVAELPTPWTMSCAELFAEGGVFIAQSLGADTLVFGSESGDIDSLKQTNLQLNSPLLKPELRKNLDLGQTYAAARKAAFES